MSHETLHPPASLSYTMLQVIQAALTGSIPFDSLIRLLSLMCLLSIVQQMPSQSAAPPAPSSTAAGTQGGDTLQKLISQLAKTDTSGTGDTLTGLLPLLNNPQVKSKLTPANMATILGLLSTMNAVSGDKSDKGDKEKEKSSVSKESPAATVTEELPTVHTISAQELGEHADHPPPFQEKQRYLEWKTNF